MELTLFITLQNDCTSNTDYSSLWFDCYCAKEVVTIQVAVYSYGKSTIREDIYVHFFEEADILGGFMHLSDNHRAPPTAHRRSSAGQQGVGSGGR